VDRWPLPAHLDEVGLEARLFPAHPTAEAQARPAPDWGTIHDELRSQKHVTLQLLWQEYKQSNPDGYQYTSAVAALDCKFEYVDGVIASLFAIVCTWTKRVSVFTIRYHTVGASNYGMKIPSTAQLRLVPGMIFAVLSAYES
jgi:hypothetical protein